jgi:hypothetical protein
MINDVLEITKFFEQPTKILHDFFRNLAIAAAIVVISWQIPQHQTLESALPFFSLTSEFGKSSLLLIATILTMLNVLNLLHALLEIFKKSQVIGVWGTIGFIAVVTIVFVFIFAVAAIFVKQVAIHGSIK